MHRATRLFALVPLLVFAGCSKTDTTAPSIETTAFASSLGISLSSFTRTADGLYYRDVTAGTGAVVGSTQTVSTNYSLWLANGTLIDSNAGTGQPATFRLGVGQVIPAWDQGIPGMRVGGTRQLIVPPALGYGASGSGPVPGNAILVFSVQVVSAQ